MTKKSTLIVSKSRCRECGATVGILWFRGQTTLFDGPLDADGEDLVVVKHLCPARPDAPPTAPNDAPKR